MKSTQLPNQLPSIRSARDKPRTIPTSQASGSTSTKPRAAVFPKSPLNRDSATTTNKSSRRHKEMSDSVKEWSSPRCDQMGLAARYSGSSHNSEERSQKQGNGNNGLQVGDS